MVEKLRQIP